jgi:tetratricopeptide (TPR) repeat protein
VRWRLGRALELADRQTEAKLVYEDALAANADDAMAHALLGNLLVEEQNYPDARSHLEQAVQLGLVSAQILTQLGYVAAQQKEYEKARALLNQAAQIDPTIARDVRQLIARITAEERQSQGRKGR